MSTRRNHDFDDPNTGAVSAIRRILGRTKRMHGRGSLLTFVVVLFMIAMLVGVLWYSQPRESGVDTSQTVPVIRADAEPFRVKPEDRGGMDVPYRDSTIFQTLKAIEEEAEEEHVENLLDEKETIEAGSRFAGLNTKSDEATKTINLFDEDPEESTEKEPSVASAPVKPERVAKVSNETRELVKSVLKQQEEAEKVASIEPAAGSAISSGNFFVQLVSLQTREAAVKSWPGLQKKHNELNNANYRVQEADLGERGKFYRVQAGPFKRDRADGICESIKSRNPGGCLVVGR